ncbi:hypothetical protein F4859DRAFT_265335 [Xylaria cf. heliscus]|nr:hypothetical protein F4859DRAFT_265335 [Xylaria cf. heliscus]
MVACCCPVIDCSFYSNLVIPLLGGFRFLPLIGGHPNRGSTEQVPQIALCWCLLQIGLSYCCYLECHLHALLSLEFLPAVLHRGILVFVYMATALVPRVPKHLHRTAIATSYMSEPLSDKRP